jgi:adenylate kinase family enzyme
MCATGQRQWHQGKVTHQLAPLEGRQRILMLGSGGSGKSTLARQLGNRLRLPVIHLDIHYWSHGWKPTPDEEWRERVQQLVQGERWVMDGNFSGSLPIRLARCDAAVFLDVSRWVCVRSVLLRWLRYRFAQRPDLPEGCPEKIDLAFLSWVWNFPARSRPKVLEALQRAGPGVEVLQLTRRAQTRELLNALQGGS